MSCSSYNITTSSTSVVNKSFYYYNKFYKQLQQRILMLVHVSMLILKSISIMLQVIHLLQEKLIITVYITASKNQWM